MKQYDLGTYYTLHLYKISGHCKPRCYTVTILLDNFVIVLWALYGRIQLQTYRARYGAYEPRHEKNGCLHMRNKDADQLRGQRLCFRYTESTIPLLPKSEISSY